MAIRSVEYLQSLVRELAKLPDETEWVEFKCNNKQPQMIGEYISALSNSAALCERPKAYLVWGVDDTTHKIVGTEFQYRKMKKGNEELEAWLSRMLSPRINFRFFEVPMDEGMVVLMEIPCAEKQPVQFAGGEFIRIGTNKKNLKEYCKDGEKLHQWGNSSIRAVLNRNNYYGDLVQRKYESRFQRGEKWCDILDESQWIITPNAHEAIISRELFDKAQVRLKAAQQKAAKTTAGWEEDERVFYNVFYCGDCKRKMCTRRYGNDVLYFCNAAQYRDERKCSHKSISEGKLQKIVRSELTRQFQLSGLRKKDMSAISNAVFLSKIKEIQTEIRKLDADMERRSEKLAQAFMQYKEGELSKAAYIEMKDDRNNWKAFCEKRKKSLEQIIRKLEKQQKEEARFLRSLLELDGTTRINAELVEGLIESMYLYGDGRLEINFGFKGAVEHE